MRSWSASARTSTCRSSSKPSRSGGFVFPGRSISATSPSGSPRRCRRSLASQRRRVQLRRHRRDARRPHAAVRRRGARRDAAPASRGRARDPRPLRRRDHAAAPADGRVPGGREHHPQPGQPHPRLLAAASTTSCPAFRRWPGRWSSGCSTPATASLFDRDRWSEASILVYEAGESQLIPAMEAVEARVPGRQGVQPAVHGRRTAAASTSSSACAATRRRSGRRCERCCAAGARGWLSRTNKKARLAAGFRLLASCGFAASR